MYKQGMKIDTSDNDIELTTNPCSSDRNCINKGALGKFFRKQDFGKIQRRKKTDAEEKSLMCYLTPKNCEDSTKIIKEKFRENRTQLSINNFISLSATNINIKPLVRPTVNTSLVEQPTSRTVSIQRGRLQSERLKINLAQKSLKQAKGECVSSRQNLGSKMRMTSSIRNFKQSEMKRQEQNLLNNLPSSKSISTTYEKEMKKLKNQCEHYSQLLQVCNKEKQQSQNQIKSLNSLVSELKQRNSSLLISKQDLQKEILQLNTQLTTLNGENSQLKKELEHIGDQNFKYIQEISYLKSSITQLNERIEIMLQSQGSTTPKNNKNLTSSIILSNSNSSLHNSKRINSMCFVSKNDEDTTQEDLKLLVHQLQEQLKYSQVEVNMLKRVKMDINKKNDQFIKLQRQNQILKNQIFDMKMNNVIEQQSLKNHKTIKSHNTNKSGFYPSNNRNNFQISLQRGGRNKDGNKGKEWDNKSESSDTLSLNLSLSPEKDRFRS